MNTEAPAVPTETHTCLITLVTPGSSDRVIKVWPAQHEAEKIFLDNAPGIERWDAVLRTLNNYARRGERVPKPAPWHSSSQNLAVPDLRPEDIPLVRLDGAVLEAPPKVERFAKPAPVVDKTAVVEAKLEERMNRLEDLIFNLASKIQAPTSIATDVPMRGKPGRKPKED